MENKIKCCICLKPMNKEEWIWGEEDAHKECVIEEADVICSNKCGWLSISDDLGELCPECGGKMIKITKKDKEELRNFFKANERKR